MENPATAKRRVQLLDTLRGIALIYMVYIHVMFDLVYMFNVDVPKIFNDLLTFQIFDTGAFVFLAGITVRFSRNAAKHGARLMLIAAVFTLVTAFFFPGGAIYFGALHLISTGMLVYGALGEYIDKVPWWVGLIISILIFVFTYNTSRGFFGIGDLTVPVPSELTFGSLINYFGFTDNRFSSVDYLPILPWLFLFLCGVFVGKPLLEKELPKFAYRDFCPPLTWLGRKSLLIYVLHQPIIYGLLYVLFEFILRK